MYDDMRDTPSRYRSSVCRLREHMRLKGRHGLDWFRQLRDLTTIWKCLQCDDTRDHSIHEQPGVPHVPAVPAVTKHCHGKDMQYEDRCSEKSVSKSGDNH